MKTSSRLPGRAAVVGLESGPKSTLQTARPAWGLLRAGDLPLLNAFKIDESEEDAFNMLGSAIVDAVGDDPAHTAALFELWEELVEQRKLS
jgi:hypothetical protein